MQPESEVREIIISTLHKNAFILKENKLNK